MEHLLNRNVLKLTKSPIRVFNQLAKETPGCISLTLGEPEFDTPAEVKARVAESLNAGDTHYIANAGTLALRQAIADFEREQNGMDYEADEIIVTAGATEALYTALMGILNPGEEVVVIEPAFGLYKSIITICNGVAVTLDTSEDDFQVKGDKLKALISDKTKAIIINSPNNPTGCVLNRESLDAIHDVVAENDIFVICDDVYRQLVYTEDYEAMASYRDLRDKILVVQSYSKPYAMTGWRMGYLMGSRAIIEWLTLVHQYQVVSTPSYAQTACIEALKISPKEMLEAYDKRRRFVIRRLEEIGMEVSVPEGAFYVFPSIEKYGLTSSEFCTRLIKEAKVAATPGFCFGSDKHIRLSYCCSDEDLAEGINRIEKFVQSL